MTVNGSEELAHEGVRIFCDKIAQILGLRSINPVLMYQTVTIPQLENMRKRGGNPLGLGPHDRLLYLIPITC